MGVDGHGASDAAVGRSSDLCRDLTCSRPREVNGMQCHKPRHRASARCVSALLAAGMLFAIVTGYASRTPKQPVIQAVAVGLPSVPSAASTSAALGQRSERLAEYALTRSRLRAPLFDDNASGSPARSRPIPELADTRRAASDARPAGRAQG